MCRSVVQSPDDPLARGINLSVALLVSAPFAVAGSIGGWLAYTYGRARRRPAGGSSACEETNSSNLEDEP